MSALTIAAGCVVAGEDLEPLADAAIVVDDERIAWIGPAESAPVGERIEAPISR